MFYLQLVSERYSGTSADKAALCTGAPRYNQCGLQLTHNATASNYEATDHNGYS
jgi:hypothetical protein